SAESGQGGRESAALRRERSAVGIGYQSSTVPEGWGLDRLHTPSSADNLAGPGCCSTVLINISRKSRDFSHGMDRPLLSPFMGLFVYLCIFLIIDIFLNNFFTHITQCAHIVTR